MSRGRSGSDDRDGRRFRALTRSAFDMISEIDRKGRVTYVSPNHASLHGRDPDELAGELGFDGVLPEDQERVARSFAGLFRDGESARVTFRVADREGEIHWVECTGTPIESENGEWRALLLSREITDQKRLEQQLYESREQLRNILDNAYDMIAEIDERGRVVYVNQQALEVMGLSADGSWTLDPETVLHPEDREMVVDAFREVLQGGKPGSKVYRVAHADGRWRWIEGRYRGVTDAEGHIHTVVISRDLTESLEAERLRAESEARYRDLVESSPLGIIVVQDGRIVFSNPAGAAVCGAESVESVVGRDMFSLLDLSDSREVAERLARIDRGEPLPGEMEVRIRGLDGQRREVLAAGRRIEFRGAPAYQGIVRDVSGLRRAEEDQKLLELQLQEARKLESLGVLAGGIAHDFNNLLAVILANARFAEREAADPELRDALSDAIEAAEQAARLTHQLLEYAGRRSPDVRATDLSELVRAKTNLLRSALGQRVELVLDLDPELPRVRADVVQLEQVLMNLVVNAGEAIGGDDGRVRVATGHRSVAAAELARWVGAGDLPPGEYAYLEVEDTGPGLEPDARDLIFEPFFTTKPEGHGLGLAAVIGLVRGHRGGIELDTTLGRGTRFRVHLPVDPHAEAADPLRACAVLLVAPDPEVRSVALRALERRDLLALPVDGPAAVDLLGERADEIVAAICAVDDPDEAETLARALRKARPSLPLLLTGRAAADPAAGDTARAGRLETLVGPVTIEALETRLEALLGKE
jgi:PAS domain S-box-containing protein